MAYVNGRHSWSAFCAARQDVGTGPPSPSVTGKASLGIVGGIGRGLLCAGQIRGSDERARPCQSPLPDVLPSSNSDLGTEGVASRSAPKIGLPKSEIRSLPVRPKIGHQPIGAPMRDHKVSL